MKEILKEGPRTLSACFIAYSEEYQLIWGILENNFEKVKNIIDRVNTFIYIYKLNPKNTVVLSLKQQTWHAIKTGAKEKS